ncbi:hypothetical protein PIB30_029263 [Stylosanthes scabra]|uniref:Uncharacterized protein n=1 Tax=Stylosanthes scabra TaxID=79078 RepID=A0ABU6UB39_9FABA|nr:hypothetical protein [Stylosanthes scabra]
MALLCLLQPVSSVAQRKEHCGSSQSCTATPSTRQSETLLPLRFEFSPPFSIRPRHSPSPPPLPMPPPSSSTCNQPPAPSCSVRDMVVIAIARRLGDSAQLLN